MSKTMNKGRMLRLTQLSVLVALLLIFSWLDIFPDSDRNPAVAWILFVILFPSSIWNWAHGVYLTEQGIELCRFGKRIRTLSWEQVAQICCAHDFRITLGNADDRKILIVPQCCEKYDKKKWSGFRYRFTHRKQILWADNSKKNRQFLEQYFGEIEDQT